jgi:hypothetical protein
MTSDQLIKEFGLQQGGDVVDGFNAGAGASDTSTKAFAQEDAAQSFLKEKLAKNRYTQKQQDTLDAYGGGKEFSSGSNKVVTNQDAIDSFESNGGKGTLEERYAEKFGSSAGADLQGANNAAAANKIYDQIKSLESDDYWAQQDLGSLMSKAGHQENIVNIGNYTKDGGLAVDASIQNGINFDSVQGQLDEKGWNGEKNNSIGQLGSALLAAEGTGGKEAIIEEQEIEESPEIKQAKERVKTYENDVLSGKVSEDIYGGGSDYSFNAAKGAAGIGTPMSGDSGQQASKATASFLDNKKSQVKDKYQFNASAPAGAYDSKPNEAQYQEDTFSGSDISPFNTPKANVQAAASFLKDQKNKTIKQANIQPVV